VAIIGAGNLGRALADYPGFRAEGFEIGALFDIDPDGAGRQSKGGVPILHVDQFARMVTGGEIDIAVVAVPSEAAQAVVTQAVEAGIKAILNFSPGRITVPPGVKLKNVDLTVSLDEDLLRALEDVIGGSGVELVKAG